jgi:predicted ferric reductase
MDQRLLRVVWLSVFGAIVGAPVLAYFAMPSYAMPGTLAEGSMRGGMWHGLSVLTGLLCLSAMVCAAVLPSRLRSLNRAFGIESVIELHRFIGVVTAALVFAHLACVVAADPTNVALLDLVKAPLRAQGATGSTLALVALAALALLRKQAKLSYELWRMSHIVFAVAALFFAAVHVWNLGQLITTATFATLFGLMLVLMLVVFGYRWAWRRVFDPSTEFVVRDVRQENKTVSTLVLEPRSHNGGPVSTWAFAPGQFAWIRLDRSVLAEEHPFTIASSAHNGATEFTIRHAGDFTRTIRQLPPGSPVWVDGPHGAFTNDSGDSTGFVLMAGGVGITPMMSMIRTAAHRGDPRPYRLVVVASAPEDLLFRSELARLRLQLDLEVTEVLRRPVEGWSGPIGGIDVELMSVVLAGAEQPDGYEFFICGPPAMVTDALGVLDLIGVAPQHVHTEQFDFA